MAILTSKSRTEVIRRILSDAFKPRFDAIAKLVQIEVRDILKKQHPKFLELVKDEGQSHIYLSVVFERFILKG